MKPRAGACLLLAAGLVAVSQDGSAQVVFGRLTTPTAGLELDAGARDPAISFDGFYVAFVSSSSNLGAPSGGALNPHRYDVALDSYVLAAGSVGNGNSTAPSISAGGVAVAFESLATNLAAGGSGFADVFYSIGSDSGGGVVFSTVLVSDGLGGAAPNGASRYASVSADGLWVAYHSEASNLVAGDTNNVADIFIDSAAAGFAGAERISVTDAGSQILGPSRQLSPAAVSSDGRLVVFAVDTPVSIDGSVAGTLEDVFVRDRLAGTTRLISKSTANVAGTSSSDQPSIAPGGRFVAFRSFSPNLVAVPSGSRIYVRDRQAGTTTNMPLPAGAESCEEPRISDLGDIIAQCSMPSPVAQQVFLYRAAAGVLYQLSTSVGSDNGNGTSGNATGISADGNLMVFDSAASDLVPADGNSATDAFIAADLDGLNALFADGFE